MIQTSPDKHNGPIEMIKFKIVDTKTGYQVGGLYADQTRARRRVDKLDNQYGGYRYAVREVFFDGNSYVD